MWTPLASKFRITRDDVSWNDNVNGATSFDEVDRKREIDFIAIGHVLQNRFWMELSTVCEAMETAKCFHAYHPDWRPEQLGAQILPSSTLAMNKQYRDRNRGPGLLRKDGSSCIVH